MTLVAVAGGLAAAGLFVRETILEVYPTVWEKASRRADQLRAIGVGMPLSVVLVAWVLFGAFAPARPFLAAVVALSAGLVARLAWLGFTRFRSRVADLPEPPRDAPTVVVHAYDLDLPGDLGRVYYARVNVQPVAAPTLDEAVDAVLERAEAAFENGRTPRSTYALHAKHVRDDGVPDIETTRRRLRAECRRRLEAWSDESDAETLERRCERASRRARSSRRRRVRSPRDGTRSLARPSSTRSPISDHSVGSRTKSSRGSSTCHLARGSSVFGPPTGGTSASTRHRMVGGQRHRVRTDKTSRFQSTQTSQYPHRLLILAQIIG